MFFLADLYFMTNRDDSEAAFRFQWSDKVVKRFAENIREPDFDYFF